MRVRKTRGVGCALFFFFFSQEEAGRANALLAAGDAKKLKLGLRACVRLAHSLARSLDLSCTFHCSEHKTSPFSPTMRECHLAYNNEGQQLVGRFVVR
jgi:hypothetical protein